MLLDLECFEKFLVIDIVVKLNRAKDMEIKDY